MTYLPASAAAATLLLLAASAAHAAPVEYYRYFIAKDVDTTLVIVASYDTVALQLTAEVQRSPLGTASQSAPLTDLGGGHLRGNVFVSVLGPDSQAISLNSTFDRMSSRVTFHADSLHLNFAIPPSVALQTTSDATDDYLKVKLDLTYKFDSEKNSAYSVFYWDVRSIVGDASALQFHQEITSYDGIEDLKSTLTLKTSLNALGGTITLTGRADYLLQPSDRTFAINGTATYSNFEGKLLAVLSMEDRATSAGKTTTWGTGVNLELIKNFTLNFKETRRYADQLGIKTDSRLGFTWSPREPWAIWVDHYRIKDDGFMSDRRDHGTYLGLQFPLGKGKKKVCEKLQSRVCCPDTNTCAVQQALTAVAPVDSGAAVEVVYRNRMQPGVPTSFVESMQIQPVSSSPALWVERGQWYAGAFPANETAGLPGTAGFDTCGALVQSGINQAQRTNDTGRPDIPGDTVVANASNPGDQPYRVDMVFRVCLGPGNYVVVGDKSSGVRQVPSNPVAARPGDGSWLGEYMANNGEFGTPGGHGGAWKWDVWNSARCDTAEQNNFNAPDFTPDTWATMMHELDPHFATLGIVKKKCFLVDTAGPNNSTNITCTDVPAWALDPVLGPRAGYDGVQTTKEFTKIIPDGLLTAGSHFEYFLRLSRLADPVMFWMCPDTNFIFPQSNEGPSYDAHRWQGFGILPDRWKDMIYGGLGAACMLVVDYNNERGDERAFVSQADSIGMTALGKMGAHNGWHCDGSYVAADGSHDYTFANVGSLGQYAATVPMNTGKITIWRHGGNPGTTWDFYPVPVTEPGYLGSGGIGDRLVNGIGMGRRSMHGPTLEMLHAYYKVIYLFSGDMSTNVLGPGPDRGSDDVAMLDNFLTYGADYRHPRGLWVMGDGFVESETRSGGAHLAFLSDRLAVALRDSSYYALSGNSGSCPDLTTTNVISAGNHVFGVVNTAPDPCCTSAADVLSVNTAVPGATVAGYYEDSGSNGPYVASVYTPSTEAHPYETLVDGYDLTSLRARFGNSSLGRQLYFMDVLVNVFGSICPFTPTPTVDVPENTVRSVDFLGDPWGNPVLGGSAVLHFSLAKKDQVEIKVYDVAGRLVRTLVDRPFAEGPQAVTWDGRNDQGQRVSRGVYFTQVRYINSGFVDARKMTILK